jgi:hypothetical protein
MNEYKTKSQIRTIKKNLGLTPADYLILEIQKPKKPTSIKYRIDKSVKNYSKKPLMYSATPDVYKLYKDPKVSII